MIYDDIYQDDEVMAEMANLVDDFDEDNLLDVFRTQILSEDSYDTVPIDHLYELNQSFERSREIEGVDSNEKDMIKERYYTICIAIADYISERFGITIDTNTYMESCMGDLPGLTYATYKFFMLDLFDNNLEMLCSYIGANLDELYKNFEDGSRKDVSTIMNHKNMNPKYATIVSNIYDIISHVYDMVDTETFFEYISDEYVPGKIVQMMHDSCVITGDFVYSFKNLYRRNLSFKSKLAMEVILKIKDNGYLPISSKPEELT